MAHHRFREFSRAVTRIVRQHTKALTRSEFRTQSSSLLIQAPWRATPPIATAVVAPTLLSVIIVVYSPEDLTSEQFFIFGVVGGCDIAPNLVPIWARNSQNPVSATEIVQVWTRFLLRQLRMLLMWSCCPQPSWCPGSPEVEFCGYGCFWYVGGEFEAGVLVSVEFFLWKLN